jgi:acetyl-CoA hydrolase
VHRNAQVEVRHSHATHLPAALAPQRLLHAINGALEVDLSGQVNCESLRGKPRGGIGGLLDFSRAARECAGGKAITVLPASAKGASAKETSAKETSAKGASAAHAGGRTSRIVAQLSGPATVGRADVDVVVTEHGVADLRNASLAERAQRLIAIAAPEFREGLQAQARQLLA